MGLFPARPRGISVLSLLCAFVVEFALFSVGALAAPSITLSKKIGPPTSKILVSGSGFEANVGVDIFFDTTDEALVVTDSNGSFQNAAICAPHSALPGEHWVTALERNNNKGDRKPFVAFTNWPQYGFSPDLRKVNPYENVLNSETVRNLALKWKYPMGGGISTSAAVADGFVYFNSGNYTFALTAEAGDLRWSYGADVTTPSAPAVHAGTLYEGTSFQPTGFEVIALDDGNGDLVWTFPTGDSSSFPTLVNGVVYEGSFDTNIYALNADTGVLLWKYATQSWVNGPAVSDDTVYATSWDGAIYALDARTGTLIWMYTVGRAIEASPAVAEGLVYFVADDGHLHALNAESGSPVWTHQIGIGLETQDSSPAVAGGFVYVSSLEGDVYALNASTGDLLWKRQIGTAIYHSSPAVANGVVYICTEDGQLYALDAKTGDALWRSATGNLMWGIPAVANGVVYLNGQDGTFYAFGLPGADIAGSTKPTQKESTIIPDQ